jgi:hypothetical protein
MKLGAAYQARLNHTTHDLDCASNTTESTTTSTADPDDMDAHANFTRRYHIEPELWRSLTPEAQADINAKRQLLSAKGGERTERTMTPTQTNQDSSFSKPNNTLPTTPPRTGFNPNSVQQAKPVPRQYNNVNELHSIIEDYDGTDDEDIYARIQRSMQSIDQIFPHE